jgi:hypothetical protein
MDSDLQQLKQHVQRLEHYLSLEAGEDQVLFAPAAPEILAEITTKYNLPEMYLNYLTTFGRNAIDLGMFSLFSAKEVLEKQKMWTNYFRLTDASGKRLEQIEPGIQGMLFIGENELDDPIMLNLNKGSGIDAPVMSAMHDNYQSEDDLYEESPTFLEYLEMLAYLGEATSS